MERASNGETRLLPMKKDIKSVSDQSYPYSFLISRQSLLFDLLIVSISAAIIWNCSVQSPVLRPFWAYAESALWSALSTRDWGPFLLTCISGAFVLLVIVVHRSYHA